MKLSHQQIDEIAKLAKTINVETAALIALVKVESNGVIFATVAGMQVPLIRWEGHYFYRLLKGKKRDRALSEGLAHPEAGAVKNPRSQEGRYAILNRASKIDQDAAYSSISVGVGQVMGSHWQDLGFTSPIEVLKLASRGLAGQVELMVRFISKNGLVDELQRRDWSGVARGYNGPAYKKNAYDTKMARAYTWALELLGEIEAPAKSAAGMLRMGSRGAAVREVQRLLARAGFPVKVDGDFGPSTKKAVVAFQVSQKLEADGVVGPVTNARLMAFKSQEEDLTKQNISELPEAKSAAAGAGGGLAVAMAAEKLQDIAGKISGGEVMQTVASGIYAAAGVLIVGSIVFGIYGYVKSRQTYEGVS